ncbi:hypothetical protein [Bradyrhizobium sp.]|uniref:hypothetical protein n=1 Tax=Bradyrhizobium sp. TaxID=376 RepID=UPI002613B896|nr:hypothetical protein [Bradyrhizobium sp.]
MARTYGSYMLQPTKDQYRHWLSEAQSDLKQEKSRRRIAEHNLGIASRFIGSLVLQGKIPVPADRLGELVLQIASEREAEDERERLLAGITED